MTRNELTEMLKAQASQTPFTRTGLMATQHILHARNHRSKFYMKNDGWAMERYSELVRQGFGMYNLNNMDGWGKVLNSETAWNLRRIAKQEAHRSHADIDYPNLPTCL